MGTQPFWGLYKWNEIGTFNLKHDKVIALAIEQANNSMAFFKNYESFVKDFHDGVVTALKAFKDAKVEKIVAEVNKYNATTNVKLTRTLEKLFPDSAVSFHRSQVLLGGKMIMMGDERNHKFILTDVEVHSHPVTAKRGGNLDIASEAIKFDSKSFKQFAETAKEAVKTAETTIGKIKSLMSDVTQSFEAIDKATYDNYLSGEDKITVRNFVRDVSLMIDTISAGAVMKYYEVFAEKLTAAESLVKK